MGSEKEQLLDKETKSYFSTIKGIAAAFGIVILFASSATAVQLLERRIPDMELNSCRCAAALIGSGITFLISRDYPLIPRDEISATVVYTVNIFISALFYFVAVSLLPIALAACVTYTSGVVSALFIFSMCWHEKLILRNVLLSMVSVAGVVLVIQPWKPTYFRNNGMFSLTHTDDNVYNVTLEPQTEEITDETQYQNVMEEVNTTSMVTNDSQFLFNPAATSTLIHYAIGYSFSVIAGITLTAYILIVKRNPFLGDKHMFWTFLINTLVSLILMVTMETPVLPSNWFNAAMVTLHSVESAFIWRLYIYAPRYISGNTFALILTSDVVFMLVAQYTVLSSILPGHRNWLEVVGVLLVLLGCSMTSILELIKSKDTNS